MINLIYFLGGCLLVSTAALCYYAYEHHVIKYIAKEEEREQQQVNVDYVNRVLTHQK